MHAALALESASQAPEQHLGQLCSRPGLATDPVSTRLAPLVVALDGARRSGERGVRLLQPQADATGTTVLAPEARGTSWDILLGEFDTDIDFIDTALTGVFNQNTIDSAHVSIGGFSDGASYALSVGNMNGDLFSHILAFSPGFASPAVQRCAPLIYVSRGTRDSVLPIDRCSRQLVPLLTDAGCDVTYREIDGPTAVPPEIAHDAIDWFLETHAATTTH